MILLIASKKDGSSMEMASKLLEIYSFKKINDSLYKYKNYFFFLITYAATPISASTTHAYYSYTNTSSGMYVFMYIPHFSNHTMVVSNEPFIKGFTEFLKWSGEKEY